MKLLTYDSGSGPRCGVLSDNLVVDVSALLGADEALRDVRALLELGDSPIDRVREALASDITAPAVPLPKVRLRAPRFDELERLPALTERVFVLWR